MKTPSVDRLAIVLLAAGQSRRFGPRNKLLAAFNGKPLVRWAAETAPAAAHRIVVCTSPEVAQLLSDWDVVMLEGAPPQSASLKAGIARADAMGASHALVMLGDMPLVSPRLLQSLLAHAEGAAAFNGTRPLPPALFPRSAFAALQQMEGDRGAGPLLKTLPFEEASPEELVDIDTEETLARLMQI